MTEGSNYLFPPSALLVGECLMAGTASASRRLQRSVGCDYAFAIRDTGKTIVGDSDGLDDQREMISELIVRAAVELHLCVRLGQKTRKPSCAIAARLKYFLCTTHGSR